MTLIIEPDWNSTLEQRVSQRMAAAEHIRSVAVPLLGPVDIRDAIVGAVGATVTGLTTRNFPTAAGSSTAPLDLVLKSTGGQTGGTTFVGWLEQASQITAYQVSDILVQNQSPIGAVYTIYGLTDLTPRGDLVALRFYSGANKVKGYVGTERIYESNNNELIGGTFVDDQTTDVGAIDYGMSVNEPMGIQGIWETAADKYMALKVLVAEKFGNTITEPPS